MGCCLSTTVPSKYSGQQSAFGIDAPLPPVLDQETVKEVLSETQTPISQPHASVAKSPVRTSQTTVNNRSTSVLQSPTARPVVNKIEPNQRPIIHQVAKKIEPYARVKEATEEELNIVSEVSGTSEMYTFSSSYSNATTVKDMEESGEVNQRVSYPDQAKKRSYSRECNVAKYRELKSRAPLQVKYQVRSKLAQGRSGTHQHRNVRPINGTQRSVLPARRGEAIERQKVEYRTPVWNVTARSGGQSPARKAEGSEKMERFDDTVSMESLENPRVSMECFIFL